MLRLCAKNTSLNVDSASNLNKLKPVGLWASTRYTLSTELRLRYQWIMLRC